VDLGLAKAQKLLKLQFSSTNSKCVIDPGKIHRVTADCTWELWKLEVALPKIESGEITVAIPEGSTGEEAFRAVGVNWREIPSFGFVSVNGMRVMITDALRDGDLLKTFSRVGGG
jgi:hypothetical protein